MTHSLTPKFKPSDEDIAREILAAQGRPMYYYDLIREVLSAQERPLDPTHISRVLTQINLDTRFSYLGNGEWGLKVWVPTKGTRRLPTITLMNKELVYDDANDLDSDKDLLFEDIEEELDEVLESEHEEDPFEKEEELQERKGDRKKNSW